MSVQFALLVNSHQLRTPHLDTELTVFSVLQVPGLLQAPLSAEYALLVTIVQIKQLFLHLFAQLVTIKLEVQQLARFVPTLMNVILVKQWLPAPFGIMLIHQLMVIASPAPMAMTALLVLKLPVWLELTVQLKIWNALPAQQDTNVELQSRHPLYALVVLIPYLEPHPALPAHLVTILKKVTNTAHQCPQALKSIQAQTVLMFVHTRPTPTGEKLPAQLALVATSVLRRLASPLKSWVAHKAPTVAVACRLSAHAEPTASRNVPLFKLKVVLPAPQVTTASLVLSTSSSTHVLSALTAKTVSTLHAQKVPLVTLYTECHLTIARLAKLVLPAVRQLKLQPPVAWLTTVPLVPPRQVSPALRVLSAVTNPERQIPLSA